MRIKLKPSKKFARIKHIIVNGTMVATGFDRCDGTFEVMPHAQYFNYNNTVIIEEKRMEEWFIKKLDDLI
ncbi:hypothetical protein [Jeotgalibacillus marinus]|uniref:Phage protein n=1 Tax=Jeotgalibacillus marinus TaxID=86667 RepID=A0ABV3Q7U4_9BACL